MSRAALYTLACVSARAIKLFVVLPREKRVPRDITVATRVLFLCAADKGTPRPRGFSLLFLRRGNMFKQRRLERLRPSLSFVLSPSLGFL